MDINASAIAAQRALVVNPTVKQVQDKGPAQTATNTTEQTTQTTSGSSVPVRVVKGNAYHQAYAQAEQYQRQHRTFYDQPKQHHRQALETYQSLQNAEQKDAISQMMGVDLFA